MKSSSIVILHEEAIVTDLKIWFLFHHKGFRINFSFRLLATAATRATATFFISSATKCYTKATFYLFPNWRFMKTDWFCLIGWLGRELYLGQENRLLQSLLKRVFRHKCDKASNKHLDHQNYIICSNIVHPNPICTLRDFLYIRMILAYTGSYSTYKL